MGCRNPRFGLRLGPALHTRLGLLLQPLARAQNPHAPMGCLSKRRRLSVQLPCRPLEEQAIIATDIHI